MSETIIRKGEALGDINALTHWGISRRTLDRMVQDGRIPQEITVEMPWSFRGPGGPPEVRFRKEALAHWCAEQVGVKEPDDWLTGEARMAIGMKHVTELGSGELWLKNGIWEFVIVPHADKVFSLRPANGTQRGPVLMEGTFKECLSHVWSGRVLQTMRQVCQQEQEGRHE